MTQGLLDLGTAPDPIPGWMWRFPEQEFNRGSQSAPAQKVQAAPGSSRSIEICHRK